MCSTASAATSCARCPSPSTSRGAWPTCRCACTRTSSSPTRCSSIRGEEVILLPAKTRYEQDDGGTRDHHRAARHVQPGDPAPGRRGAGPSGGSCASSPRAVDPERAELLGCETRRGDPRARSRASCRSTTASSTCSDTGDAFQYGGPHLCAGWTVPHRRRQGALSRPCRCRRSTRPAGTFEVSTRRGKQFNTLIYAEIDPLTGAARDAVLHEPRRRRRAAPRQRRPRRAGQRARPLRGPRLPRPDRAGNLQVHWPEGNVLIPRGVVDPIGGVPDYNALVRVERP